MCILVRLKLVTELYRRRRGGECFIYLKARKDLSTKFSDCALCYVVVPTIQLAGKWAQLLRYDLEEWFTVAAGAHHIQVHYTEVLYTW